MADRVTAKVTIRNRLGLHARPAMQLVDTAAVYPCSLTIKKGSDEVDGKSIMHLMMLAATKGTELELVANGDGAADCVAAIVKLVEDGFDED